MLVRFSEQVVDDYLFPSFTLAKGEIVIIRLPNAPIVYNLQSEIRKILTGEVDNDHIEIISPLNFVDHFKQNRLSSYFFPTTIGRYHRKYANELNSIYKMIYDVEPVTPRTKVAALAGNARKRLSLYTTLSWTNNIIFDLMAVDPQGGVDIYNFVKTVVKSGGAAILFDQFGEFQNDCTTFVEAKHIIKNGN